MKTFKPSTEFSPQASIDHILSSNPKTVILDAGHLTPQALNPETNKAGLQLAAQIAAQIKAAGVNLQTQFLVEDSSHDVAAIAKQQKLAQDFGIELGDPIFEKDIIPAALTLVAQLKKQYEVVVGNDKTTLHMRKGRIGTTSVRLLNQDLPSGALVDASLIHLNEAQYNNLASVTVLPAQFEGQQRSLSHLLKALNFETDYTAILHK